jgi:nucleotide-binding universal stress UspA family protein
MNRIPLGSIIVGIDGSAPAERALRWAADQAQLEHRTLTAVVAADGRAGAHKVADAAVQLVRSERPGVEVSGMAVLGDAREVLLDLAPSAHLMVLGSRGRGTVRSLLLGSVSVAVAKTADCPVVICRPAQHARGQGIVVGADGTAESVPVIEFAFAQASLRGLPVTVLHCFWDVVVAAAGFRKASGDVLEDPQVEEERLLLAESVAGIQEKYPDVPMTLLSRHGLVDETLARRDRAWDLIVVGRHPSSSTGRLISGSIATAVLERAHANVAVIPEAVDARGVNHDEGKRR